LSVTGRAGIGWQHLTIEESATEATGLIDASYGGLLFRYGGGVRARLGTDRPILASVEWVGSKSWATGVGVGGDNIELEDTLDISTTELIVSLTVMLVRDADGDGTRSSPEE
jgi:hypothetical protein